ncbi:recombinase family protein [Clostridium folliculivorans]|uniref:Resolvase n=1 Tax=Clostridium folliculivorans TaxID=2886038 RepID=A0A9W5XZT7_9CLOT|nr:recombinase family protein [Clostridium folliculivorans]GKU24022.1 resolvase [Clostridium folliculivorans]GKU30137.1 resolvase [Clostridium folliculivorans]
MKAAIYSRKSIFTGKGDSIENQIELCKQYGSNLGIKDYIIYEDEGFSGGNTNRPRFQQLLKDAKKNLFNVLICYRLDRISRNVADFSTTLDMLQKYNINFISIREQFDTTTPMGRAMIYIASVFAQLERETIAERVRDNMLQLAKSGRWLGGQEPFGFAAERVTYIDSEFKERSLMQLCPLKSELNIINLIFSKYLELRSLSKVSRYLNSSNIKGKNGGQWSTMQLRRILTSPLYVKSSETTNNFLKQSGMNVFGDANGNGYLTYNKTKNITTDRDITEWIVAVSRHQGIINAEDWIKVQGILDKNREKRSKRLGTGDNTALLTGLLVCAKCGSSMKVKQGHKSKNQNKRLDYYVCSAKDNSNGSRCDNKNIRVDILDNLLIKQIKAYDKDLLISSLSSLMQLYEKGTDEENHINALKTSINEKEHIISNLVKQLALSEKEEISKYIIKEVEKLDTELKDLKFKFNNNYTTKITKSSFPKVSLFQETLCSPGDEYEVIKDVIHKRNLLNTIIDTISWNGDTIELKIKFIKS